MATPISIVVTFIFIVSFIKYMNYPRTIYFNDYINPLLEFIDKVCVGNALVTQKFLNHNTI
jgi:hypothetical protein